MTSYACLLRAVNVGGTGKLPMAALRAMCETAGFTDVRTYIASGNVVLRSASSARQVLVRTAAEMAAVLDANPFPDAAPNRTMVIFLDQPPPPDALDAATGQAGEQLALGRREIYVHYPDGMGNSKLRIPGANAGTARNLNTVARLVGMAAN